MDCASCGRANRAGARFCDACGAALTGPAAPGGAARKVVTIVFADLIGSTALQERLDPESVSRLMDRYYRAVRAPVEAHGGTVVQLLGDGVMCAFGVPRVCEDDAIRAVRAAVGMQRAFREFARGERAAVGELGLRVAVNTGEVVVSDERAAGIGDPLNVAARLQQEARDGDVLIGGSTERLVRDLVELEEFGVLSLKGRSETVTAYRVVSLERPAGAAATPFVGREDELERILAVYDATIDARAARLVVVLGSPGLGKSRLLAEAARRLEDRAAVLRARCDAAASATFTPVAEALRTFLRVDDAGRGLPAAIDAVVPGDDGERARIVEGIGALLAATPASPEETFFVVRRLLTSIAARRPVLLAIDDLQWAEPLLLDLVEHLVAWSAGAPLLVLVAARPEICEARPSLAAPGALVSEVVALGGLDAGAAARLAANAIGATELPAVVAGRVLAASEGNPLFVGELARMLVENGSLRREGERWIPAVELADLEMPPTIHALLAARIERLSPPERMVLERAAIVGRQFSRAALASLLPHEVDDVEARLESLRRSELIEADTGSFLGEPALRFHHALIRDAAYRRLLKGTRAELHARFADWIESRVGTSVEHDETIGWHLEQAHRHLGELGPLDADGRALGERASRHLGATGRRALARDDLPLAASLLGRAIERLDAAHPGRADLSLDWCEALLAAGDVEQAARAIDELGRIVNGTQSPAPDPRLVAWHTCVAGQLAVLTDPQALRTTADAVAAAARQLAAVGDAVGEAKAHSVHALALARLGEIGASEAALDRALAAARRAGDRRRANAVLAGAPNAALWGPSPVTRASGRCLDVVRVLRITQGAPAVEAVALRCQAVLEALRGRSGAARRMLASARRMGEELGITQRLLETDVAAGVIELLEENAVAAERCLRSAYDGFRAHGLAIDAAQAAALLGRALLAQGRAEEAEALSHESETLAGDDLKAAIAWRGVRAEAMAERGEHASAIELARAAIDIAAATDALLDHADARRAAAVALRAAGSGDAADAEEARAVELWEAKGATLLVERARRGRATEAGAEPVERLVSRAVATAAPPARAEGFANAASRSVDVYVRCWDARDWEGVVATHSQSARLIDHRSFMALDLGTSEIFATLRVAFDMAGSRSHGDLIATRGERLALLRWIMEAPESETAGPVELVYLAITEVDEGGSTLRNVLFDLDDADAAYDELDALYRAGEGSPHAELLAHWDAFHRATNRRDWEAVRRLLPSDFTMFSHRRLASTGTRLNRDEFIHNLRWMDDHGLRGVLRRDHMPRLSATAAVEVLSFRGRIEGGEFEQQFVSVVTHRNGQLRSFELFDLDHLDRALSRYDDSTEGAALTRAFTAAFAERDWDALGVLLAPDLVVNDHRLLGWEALHGPAAYVRALRSLVDLAPDVRLRIDHLTMSERRYLYVTTWVGTRDGGNFETPSVIVCELDALGRIRSFDQYDIDRLDEVRARFEELRPVR